MELEPAQHPIDHNEDRDRHGCWRMQPFLGNVFTYTIRLFLAAFLYHFIFGNRQTIWSLHCRCCLLLAAIKVEMMKRGLFYQAAVVIVEKLLGTVHPTVIKMRASYAQVSLGE
jgi:hypothetical protein